MTWRYRAPSSFYNGVNKVFENIGWNLPTLSCLLTLMGGTRYLYAVRNPKNPATPNIGTWVTWTSVSLLTASGMWSTGTLSPMLCASIGFNCMILLVALKGTWKPLHRTEIWCLGSAGVGLALFVYLQDSYPEIAILIGVTISVLGSIPTILKIQAEPQSEDLVAHLCGNASCFVQLLAHPGWNIATDLQPLAWLLNGLVMTSLILRPRLVDLRGHWAGTSARHQKLARG